MEPRKSRKPKSTALFYVAVMAIMAICTSNTSSAQTQVSCELTKMNVVYVGLDNPLVVAASGYNSEDLTVKITNGQIKKTADYYLIRPAKAGTVKLTVEAGGKVLDTKVYRALITPDPQAGIKTGSSGKLISKGKVTTAQLQNIKIIQAELPDFLFDIDFKVVEFEIKVFGNSGVNVVEKSNSNLITKKQKDILRTLRPGQKIFIEGIKAIGPDGTVRVLNDIKLEVR